MWIKNTELKRRSLLVRDKSFYEYKGFSDLRENLNYIDEEFKSLKKDIDKNIKIYSSVNSEAIAMVKNSSVKRPEPSKHEFMLNRLKLIQERDSFVEKYEKYNFYKDVQYSLLEDYKLCKKNIEKIENEQEILKKELSMYFVDDVTDNERLLLDDARKEPYLLESLEKYVELCLERDELDSQISVILNKYELSHLKKFSFEYVQKDIDCYNRLKNERDDNIEEFNNTPSFKIRPLILALILAEILYFSMYYTMNGIDSWLYVSGFCVVFILSIFGFIHFGRKPKLESEKYLRNVENKLSNFMQAKDKAIFMFDKDLGIISSLGSFSEADVMYLKKTINFINECYDKDKIIEKNLNTYRLNLQKYNTILNLDYSDIKILVNKVKSKVEKYEENLSKSKVISEKLTDLEMDMLEKQSEIRRLEDNFNYVFKTTNIEDISKVISEKQNLFIMIRNAENRIRSFDDSLGRLDVIVTEYDNLELSPIYEKLENLKREIRKFETNLLNSNKVYDSDIRLEFLKLSSDFKVTENHYEKLKLTAICVQQIKDYIGNNSFVDTLDTVKNRTIKSLELL